MSNRTYGLLLDENKKSMLIQYENTVGNKLIVNVTRDGFEVIKDDGIIRESALSHQRRFESFEELAMHYSASTDPTMWKAEDGRTLDNYFVVIGEDDSEECKTEQSDDVKSVEDASRLIPTNTTTEQKENEQSDDVKNVKDASILIPTNAITKQTDVAIFKSNIAPLNLSAATIEIGAKRIAEEMGKQLDKREAYKKKEAITNTANDTSIENSEPYTIDEFNNTVQGVNANTLKDILRIKQALILVSPPGTGKTTTAIELAKYITGETNSDRVKLVSFSETTSYSDIIGGYQKDNNGDWSIEKGSLFKLCDRAINDSDNIYIYIIDEINRANTQAVLGEAMTAMSRRGQGVSTNIGKNLVMPSNLYIVATMNTTDNSLISLDQAMLDRFAIYEMPDVVLDYTAIKDWVNDDVKLCVGYIYEELQKINKILGRDKFKHDDNRIGMRALFTDYDSISDLSLVFEYDIRPKVEARMYNLDDDDRKAIETILNDIELSIDNEIASECKARTTGQEG